MLTYSHLRLHHANGCYTEYHVLKLVDDTETVDYSEFELKFPSTCCREILKELQTRSFDLPIAEANLALVGAIYEKAVIAYFSEKPKFDVQEFRTGPLYHLLNQK